MVVWGVEFGSGSRQRANRNAQGIEKDGCNECKKRSREKRVYVADKYVATTCQFSADNKVGGGQLKYLRLGTDEKKLEIESQVSGCVGRR